LKEKCLMTRVHIVFEHESIKDTFALTYVLQIYKVKISPKGKNFLSSGKNFLSNKNKA
jgi:hypothetical protein